MKVYIYTMKTKIPNQQQTSDRLRSLVRDGKREEMLEAGAYDGRFKGRTETPKKFKKEKYKHKIYEY
jgi:hypothetical protein